MIKLFTHTDLDGVGCAILAKLVFKNNVDISFCNYDEINKQVEEFFLDNNSIKGYVCDITDISISDELAVKINDSKRPDAAFNLFDHHPTALKLNTYEWCTIKIDDEETGFKTCGTELYFKHLKRLGYFDESDKAVERFVNIVRDYDTWRWSTLGEEGIISKQINDLLYLYGREKFIDWCIAKINICTFPSLGETEKLILDIRQKEIDNYVELKNEHIHRTYIRNMLWGFVFADKYFSELGNRLCKMNPEIDIIGMINMDGTVSYRTIRENIDLGMLVSELYGGGGHKQAAGSQIPKSIVESVITRVIFGV